MTKNDVKIEYLCGLKADALQRGQLVDLISKSDINLLVDLIGEQTEPEERDIARIVKEEHGLSLDVMNRDLFRIRINRTCFFLDSTSRVLVGHPYDPEFSLHVTYLDYPKIRVNFNGYRFKTKEKDVNWSNYYMINEKNQQKQGLHLQVIPRGDDSSQDAILDDKSKHYYIGSQENCRFRTNKGGIVGVIKYIEDVGWIVQAKETIKDDLSYGLYMKVRQNASCFKLYQGMSLLVGSHLVTVKELC